MTLIDPSHAAIVTAAVCAAGPAGTDEPAWAARVAELVATITAMCSTGSPTARLIEAIDKAKVFTAVIAGGRREISSTRDVVRLATRPSSWHPDGIEDARTERTDTPAGAAMSRRLRSLVGHRVVLWVQVDTTEGGAQKVRVIRHVEDLGPAEVAAPPATAARAS